MSPGWSDHHSWVVRSIRAAATLQAMLRAPFQRTHSATTRGSRLAVECSRAESGDLYFSAECLDISTKFHNALPGGSATPSRSPVDGALRHGTECLLYDRLSPDVIEETHQHGQRTTSDACGRHVSPCDVALRRSRIFIESRCGSRLRAARVGSSLAIPSA